MAQFSDISADTQTHRHTDTQTHSHTDTQTHRHTDTQTHIQQLMSYSWCPQKGTFQYNIKYSYIVPVTIMVPCYSYDGNFCWHVYNSKKTMPVDEIKRLPFTLL